MPDSARFLNGPAQAESALQPIITGWKKGLYARVEVVGHCAQFGPPAGAVALSRQRAAEVSALLQQGGVTDISSTGVGYSQPVVPSNPQSAGNRVVVVTAYPKN